MATWIDDLPTPALRHWLQHTKTPLLATQLTGQDGVNSGPILWANNAAEQLLEYTLQEFTRANNPIGWPDITVDHGDLDTDIAMAKQVVAGTRHEYELFKQYRTKSGKIVPITIHVMRYPYSGEFECFFVTIRPLDGSAQQALNEIAELRGLVASGFTEISKVVAELNNRPSEFDKMMESFDKRPKMWVAIILFVLFLMMGDKVFEFLDGLMRVFGYSAG